MEQISSPFTLRVPDAAPAPASSPSRIPEILEIVWICGMAAAALRAWRGWMNLRSIVRDASPLPLGLGIDVRSSSANIEPGVFGVFRTVLLLPEGIQDRLEPLEFQAVLAHEMCHVRRRDNLATIFHMIVECLFWFHPLVWWLGARLVEERERACDEEVLRLGHDPQLYAEGILKVCRLYIASPIKCAAGVSGASLTKRIEEILTRSIAARLDLSKKLLLAVTGLAAIAVLFAGVLNTHAQAQQSQKFEVASIRQCVEADRPAPGMKTGPSKFGPPGGSPTVSPGHLNTGCAALGAEYPMAGLIQRSYGRLGLGRPPALGSALPISGGPSWIYSDYYVINARAADGTSADVMEGPMLQALLEERFHLQVRRAAREVPVYVLTVAKGGPKLDQVQAGSCVRPDLAVYPPPPLPAGQRYCKGGGIGPNGPNLRVSEEERSVDYFVKLLGLVMDRPILDRTGLTGLYNFQLSFAIDQSTPHAPPAFGEASDTPPAPSIFSAIQQLGLKLEAAKGPREYLVIDRVERPTEN
jgi:uncharacterized protein (TIGR03435 family)